MTKELEKKLKENWSKEAKRKLEKKTFKKEIALINPDLIGAIVTLEMYSGNFFYGKVVEINDDTISIVEQKLVQFISAAPSETIHHSDTNIVENLTIDGVTKIVFYRHSVKNCLYVSFKELTHLKTKLSIQKILIGNKYKENHFNSNGFCKGGKLKK